MKRKFKSFVHELLTDERDRISAKRFVGILLSLGLFIALMVVTFAKREIIIPSSLIDSISLLIFSCLGLTCVDKFIAKKNNNQNDNSSKEN